TREVNRVGALVAAWNAVAAPDPRGLHVRGPCGQRVAFPFTGGQPGTRGERIRRRFGPAVHPDRHGVAKVIAAELPCDHLTVTIFFTPDRYSARPVLHHPRRLRQALALRRARP